MQDPIGSFDLKNCSTNLVDVVGIEITMRPHTFMLQFTPPSYLLEFKGLTKEGFVLLCSVTLKVYVRAYTNFFFHFSLRLLLSADNLEERIAWCLCLNEVLKSVRSWSNAVE